MKKIIYSFFAVMLVAFTASAQVTLPYSQDFETATFVTGTGGVQFIPGWYGNQVQPTPGTFRIHRDTIYPNSTGRVCLAALPTAAVRDTIILSMTVPANNQALISFYAASDSARTATGNRSAKVSYDFSLDGGLGYNQKTALGDTAGFPRRPTPYMPYSILAPYSLSTIGTNYSLKFRLIVSRGYGTGTAARFLMDDVNITLVPTSVATENRQIKQSELVVFPNPANDVISFRVSDEAISDAKLVISDLTGRVVYTNDKLQLAQNQLFTLPNSLNTGNYTIAIQTASSVYVQKLVVAK